MPVITLISFFLRDVSKFCDQIRAWNRSLFAHRKILQREHFRTELILTQYQRVFRAQLARSLQRLFQTKAFISEFDDDVVPAEFARETSRLPIHANAERRDVNVRLAQHVLWSF